MAFMGSMLGLVFSNHLLILFIFWELTSFTSYLLIGFNHEDSRAREAALRAMLITISGGLVLLAGLLLMVEASGTWYLSELLAQKEGLREHAYYLPILICVALGAFTKVGSISFSFLVAGRYAGTYAGERVFTLVDDGQSRGLFARASLSYNGRYA